MAMLTTWSLHSMKQQLPKISASWSYILIASLFTFFLIYEVLIRHLCKQKLQPKFWQSWTKYSFWYIYIEMVIIIEMKNISESTSIETLTYGPFNCKSSCTHRNTSAGICCSTAKWNNVHLNCLFLPLDEALSWRLEEAMTHDLDPDLNRWIQGLPTKEGESLFLLGWNPGLPKLIFLQQPPRRTLNCSADGKKAVYKILHRELEEDHHYEGAEISLEPGQKRYNVFALMILVLPISPSLSSSQQNSQNRITG